MGQLVECMKNVSRMPGIHLPFWRNLAIITFGKNKKSGKIWLNNCTIKTQSLRREMNFDFDANKNRFELAQRVVNSADERMTRKSNDSFSVSHW